MAYPTGVSFKHTSGILGAQPIHEASTVQRHAIGTVVLAKDTTYGEGEFVYLLGVASTAQGDLVSYESDVGTTTRSLAGGGASAGPMAVAASDCTTGLYGWYQITGSAPVKAATVSDNTVLYLTATAGQVDDLASSGEMVDGLRAKAATSSGYATCQLNRPNVTGITSSGTNSGDVTLATVGSSPAAAGASLSGQVLTLQPASASFAGVVTAAQFSKIDTLAYFYCTLSAAAESGNAIVVTGQVVDSSGVNVAVTKEVLVRTLAVTDSKGDITVTAGTEKKTVNPATGENISWITTTAGGAFAVSVANDVAEATLITASVGGTGAGLTTQLLLNFALV